MLLPSGCGLGTAWAGRPRVIQELECPALEGGRRRGGLLIACEAVRDGGRDRGPAGELGLERCHRGDLLERGADPQEVCLCLVLDRGVEDFLPFVNPDLSNFHPICTTGSRRLRVAS